MKAKKILCLGKCGIEDLEDFEMIYEETMKNKKETKEFDFDLARKELKKEIKTQRKMTSTKTLKKFLKKV